MNIKVIAKDNNGVPRCYGTGIDGLEAMQQCIKASNDYLATRPDIKTLSLYWGDNDSPVNTYQKGEYRAHKIHNH